MSGLTCAYGADGAALVVSTMQLMADAMGPQNATVHVLAASLSSANDAQSLYAELKPLLNQPPNFILLIGDQRVFPSFSVPNPVTNRSVDPDTAVLTDNPYGMANWAQPQDAINPDIAVGRIAAGVNETANGLCTLLNSQIILRKSRPTRTGYVEVVSRQWQYASNSVLSITAPAARTIVSPDGRVTAANASDLDCKFLYCNLHGFLNSSAWSGYDQGLSYPVPALTPDAFQPQFVTGTVAFTEACYGLAIAGASTTSSNALSLMSAGAAAVIGSTGLAYGTATPQPQTLIDADILARTFFNNILAPNLSLGQCLAKARTALRATSSTSDPYVIKTLLEFQLLGDPSYVPI